jgi:hypothetical protein
MSTSDTLRLLRMRIKNNRALNTAIQNSVSGDTAVEPTTGINTVDIFNTDQTGDYNFLADVHDIMRQYLSDDAFIGELANSVGDIAVKEFVLNYQLTYLPKLKKIEGQRFNKKLFSIFFKIC